MLRGRERPGEDMIVRETLKAGGLPRGNEAILIGMDKLVENISRDRIRGEVGMEPEQPEVRASPAIRPLETAMLQFGRKVSHASTGRQSSKSFDNLWPGFAGNMVGDDPSACIFRDVRFQIKAAPFDVSVSIIACF
jgi:hypothetical protein